ncbi:MAG: hypothetical protein K2N75_02785 [Helicobacter sp.]|uniref:hypothetical protein n=1 Tax=Helicobacter sp. TaxID=218 RepID=UPI0023D28604|nr:hypothetical protein [Helicobacter sp.]MDE5925823.1 hypothetical protein [Helicobacter sp.]MDE7174966.1 hypothetical protein [Helicobacter sp.]
MKQRIKKVTYTIPLRGDLVKNGNIVVSSFDIPSKKDKKYQAVSIVVGLEDTSDSPTQWEVIIPRKQVKQLRKALKKVCK